MEILRQSYQFRSLQILNVVVLKSHSLIQLQNFLNISS
ncbi:hypothetical protein pb186bvf_003124 [Paramecium bursaria]